MHTSPLWALPQNLHPTGGLGGQGATPPRHTFPVLETLIQFGEPACSVLPAFNGDL